MLRLTRYRPFRLGLVFILTFCLIYGPLYSLHPVRAESSPSGAAPNKTAVHWT